MSIYQNILDKVALLSEENPSVIVSHPSGKFRSVQSAVKGSRSDVAIRKLDGNRMEISFQEKTKAQSIRDVIESGGGLISDIENYMVRIVVLAYNKKHGTVWKTVQKENGTFIYNDLMEVFRKNLIAMKNAGTSVHELMKMIKSEFA